MPLELTDPELATAGPAGEGARGHRHTRARAERGKALCSAGGAAPEACKDATRSHAAGGRVRANRSGVAYLALIEANAAEWTEREPRAEAVLIGNLDSKSLTTVRTVRAIQVQQRTEHDGRPENSRCSHHIAVDGAGDWAQSHDQDRACRNACTHHQGCARAPRSSPEVVPDRHASRSCRCRLSVRDRHDSILSARALIRFLSRRSDMSVFLGQPGPSMAPWMRLLWGACCTSRCSCRLSRRQLFAGWPRRDRVSSPPHAVTDSASKWCDRFSPNKLLCRDRLWMRVVACFSEKPAQTQPIQPRTVPAPYEPRIPSHGRQFGDPALAGNRETHEFS
jgi:hypothetical protein